MMRMALLALAAASSGALAGPLRPPATTTPSRAGPPATVHVTGRAEVSEAPDRVFIDVGVSTTSPTSQSASSESARRLQTVIAAIRAAVGPEVQLTTTNYALTPEYTQPSNGAAPKIAAYTAMNMVQVRLDDLAMIGRVIDAATAAGANRIEDIRFALRDPQAARSQALRQAALEAREEARALASTLDLRIVRILSVDEQGPVVVPMRRIFASAMSARAQAAPTPIESGALTVAASVALTVEVAPRAAPRTAP